MYKCKNGIFTLQYIMTIIQKDEVDDKGKKLLSFMIFLTQLLQLLQLHFYVFGVQHMSQVAMITAKT